MRGKYFLLWMGLVRGMCKRPRPRVPGLNGETSFRMTKKDDKLVVKWLCKAFEQDL